MDNKTYMKWFIEVVNQEYKGDIKGFLSIVDNMLT